ncbi:MAG: hypothetical protein HC831_27200 [Chloroflexia bacterium]|nr:hypothetical protein [Chloroflexia bacterium]
MKFNIGDRVRFLNDVGGGKVIKYIDNETVAVLNQDDFEIPVLMSELILDQAPDYASSGSFLIYKALFLKAVVQYTYSKNPKITTLKKMIQLLFFWPLFLKTRKIKRIVH